MFLFQTKAIAGNFCLSLGNFPHAQASTIGCHSEKKFHTTQKPLAAHVQGKVMSQREINQGQMRWKYAIKICRNRIFLMDKSTNPNVFVQSWSDLHKEVRMKSWVPQCRKLPIWCLLALDNDVIMVQEINASTSRTRHNQDPLVK